MPHHVITKAEAEYALDQNWLAELCERRGVDTVQTWLFQIQFNLNRLRYDRPMLRGTETDVRG